MNRSPKTLSAALGITALLAFPVGAMAQSAGDEQYSDPLQGGSQQQGGSGNSGSGNSGSSGSGSTSSGSSGSSSSGTTAQPSQSSSQGTTSQLARTGFPAILVALLGATLAAGGIALRRRTRTS